MMKRTPFLIALLNPVNLAMLGLSVAAGLCSAWWLAPIGFVLWIVMMLVIAREPALQFSHILDSRAPLASRFQKKFEGIDRAHTRIFNGIAGAKPRIQRELQSILRATSELIDTAYGICLRLTPIENNRLVTQNTGGLVLELENIKTKIDNAKDPVVKREYQQAYDSVNEQLLRNQKFSTDLERVDAQLISLKNEMDSLNQSVIALQSKSPQEVKQGVPRLLGELEEELSAFQKFEREIVI